MPLISTRNPHIPARNARKRTRNGHIPTRNVQIPVRNPRVPTRYPQVATRNLLVPNRYLQVPTRNPCVPTRCEQVPNRNVLVPAHLLDTAVPLPHSCPVNGQKRLLRSGDNPSKRNASVGSTSASQADFRGRESRSNRSFCTGLCLKIFGLALISFDRSSERKVNMTQSPREPLFVLIGWRCLSSARLPHFAAVPYRTPSQWPKMGCKISL